MPTIKCKVKKQSDTDMAQTIISETQKDIISSRDCDGYHSFQTIISEAQKDINQLIKYSMLLDKLEQEINEAQRILSAESEGNT